MLQGYVKTFGTKAITIQTAGGNQYYGPFENISDKIIMDHLTDTLTYIPVTFLPEYDKWSGETRYGKRYYATNIEIEGTLLRFK